MTTTHFFVELLVIGFGALAWLGPLVAVLLGADPRALSSSVLSSASVLPLLSVAYLLGILVDRVADWVFTRVDENLLRQHFAEDRNRYFDARRVMVVHAPALWAHLEYGRSRLRICRGWVLNAVLIALVFDLVLAQAVWAPTLSASQVTAANLLLLGIAIVSFLSWRALNRKEYSKIQRQGAWVKETLLKESGGSGE